VRTVRAIKEVDPHAVMVHVEAAGLIRPGSSEHEPLAQVHGHRRFMFLDLVTGRVDQNHSLYDWLRMHGATTADFDFLTEQAIGLDILGLNFYPQWSTKQIRRRKNGAMYLANTERAGANFAELIMDYYERYHVPIMITETSARNGLRIKQRWLKSSVTTIRHLRAAGVPVLGYTWFPLFTMVNWDYRRGRRSLGAYLIELGLFESLTEDGQLRYVATRLVEQFRSYTEEPVHWVGDLNLDA
jgi:beta-glucosidase